MIAVSAWRSDRSWAACSWSRSDGCAIFWVNIPVGIAAIALTARFVPESARGRRPSARRPRRAGARRAAAQLAHLRDHEGAGARLDLAGEPPPCSGCRLVALALLGSSARLRREGAADRAALLPQRPLLRRDGGSPFAAFAALGAFLFLNTLLPAGGAGTYPPLTAGLWTPCRWPGDDGRLRAALRAHGRPASAGPGPSLVGGGAGMAARRGCC